jgi:predicted dinucleotide-binding enzyme
MPARPRRWPPTSSTLTTSAPKRRRAGWQVAAQALPEAQIVKAFNNIYSKHLLNLARSYGAAERSSLPIAGDSGTAKTVVSEFLESIGYGAVDAGLLADGWRQQPGTPVYVTPYGSRDDERGAPAGADIIRAALDGPTC